MGDLQKTHSKKTHLPQNAHLLVDRNNKAKSAQKILRFGGRSRYTASLPHPFPQIAGNRLLRITDNQISAT